MSLFEPHDMITSGKVAKAQSIVLKVTQKNSGKTYALKRITREDYRKHISDLSELFISQKCSPHPNIIQIYGFTAEAKKISGVNIYSTIILMEYWDKNFNEEVSLRAEKNEFFGGEEYFRIVKTLILAFEYLQRRSVAHRDIKPENIMRKKNGEVCLIDFSEAIWLNNETKKEATTLVGSPYYMSPELKEFYLNDSFSPIDAYNPWRSDVYSLGRTLIDIGSLCLGEERKVKEKLGIIEEEYGENMRLFLEGMIEKDPMKRQDFLGLAAAIPCFESSKQANRFQKISSLNENLKSANMNNSAFKKKTYDFFQKLIHLQETKQVSQIFFNNKLLLGIKKKNN